MPLYRKLLGVSAAAALTRPPSLIARRVARRRAIELGAPFGVLRPHLPVRRSAWAWCTTRVSLSVAAAIEILERTLAANLATRRALVRTTRVDEPGSEGLPRELVAEGVDLLIAAGGDGTVRAVAAALAHYEGSPAAPGYSADGYPVTCWRVTCTFRW